MTQEPKDPLWDKSLIDVIVTELQRQSDAQNGVCFRGNHNGILVLEVDLDALDAVIGEWMGAHVK